MTYQKTARLALEDGTVYCGEPFGAINSEDICGEVVFNTSMVGYEEALTDPSYRGQILVLTASMIGNYGVFKKHYESEKIQCAGLIIRELSQINPDSVEVKGLSEWLKEEGVPGIFGIDTRSLVRRLRGDGTMRGVVSLKNSFKDSDLVSQAKKIPMMQGSDLASTAGGRSLMKDWDQSLDGWPAPLKYSKGFRIALVDCGAKRNIIRHLTTRGCCVEMLAPDASVEDILKSGPDGLLVSNGPGDPAAVTKTIQILSALPHEYPVMGICLGHQLLAHSIGATTYKLKFGHRGANQPVHNLVLDRVEITSQNHGFCVDEESLRDSGGIVSHRHLNDGTLAGFWTPDRPLMSVQFHPEGAPGPHDSGYLFDWFLKMVETRSSLSQEEARLVALGG